MTGKTGARWGSGGRISDDVGTCEGEGGEGRERAVKLGTGHTCDGAGRLSTFFTKTQGLKWI